MVGSVLGSGMNLTPSPKTIFSVELRMWEDRLKISVLVTLAYFLANAFCTSSECVEDSKARTEGQVLIFHGCLGPFFARSLAYTRTGLGQKAGEEDAIRGGIGVVGREG